MMWIDLRKSNVQLRHACVEITAPVIELFPQAASSSILAKSSDSAADPVGAAGWVMGVHSAATSQPHRHDRMPQLLEVHREGGTEGERERRWGEQEWRETERTLGITGAWIDLVIQSIRWGLIVCIEVEELALGKTSSLIMTRERVSILSLRGNRTANLGRVGAVISLLPCNAVVELSFNYE